MRTNDLALLPQSRWGLLPGGGESRLWYAATSSNSLLVTWVNGLLDRNPLTPTNFQAEFFPDGSYEYRYGDHLLPRVMIQLPFDRDGDGLENTVDDYMYDPPSSFRGFIMGLCRQIAQVDDKEARMEFFREFQDKVFSFDS